MTAWTEIISLAQDGNHPSPHRVDKSVTEWEAILPADTFAVTRQHGTERAFSNAMCSLFEPGEYACVCCGTALFDSGSKFESGTGWPSFGAPVADDVIAYTSDSSYGMVRIEALCNVCDAHLGHVFPDGPPPTGLRYCINAVALKKMT
jgi:peptide-methionine (R)-S-oxide reductase